MRKFSVACKLAAFALLAVASQGCKKRLNGIDNNQILSKPYSLFLADSSGQLEFTNDGDLYQTAFGNHGDQVRAMSFADTNIIMVLSSNAFVAEGKELHGGDNYNFNPINLPVSLNASWQPMIYFVKDWDRVYLAGNTGKGVIYSDTDGKRNTWQPATDFDPSITGSVAITSFTQIADGKLYGYDHINNRLFEKTAKDATSPWHEISPLNSLPINGKFFLSHINNTLVLGDSTGTNGVWYSTNNGHNWAQYLGLPATAKIMCMLAPFDRALLVGTASDGVFRLPLNETTFSSSSVGLNASINVRAAAAKSDYYKNDQIVEYVYLATDFGVYRSKDIGRTWVLLRRGNYIAAY